MRGKRIVFDVGHPAQVHQFKHLYWELEKDGWKCLVIAKKKEFSIYLLEKYKLNYITLSESKKGFFNKILNLPIDIFKYLFYLLRFRPNFVLNRFSIQSTLVSKILRIPTIGFSDTEHAINLDRITNPLIDVKLTSNSYGNDLGKNHLRFNGNIELFYLHPDIFTPDPSIKKDLGIKNDEKYAIVRFVSWEAYHDVGQKGLSLEFKRELIERLSKYVRVFISSEGQMPPDLELFRIQIPAEKIHNAMSFAHLYIGEGGSMASEAACLGTPSIYINQLDMGYVKEEARYGLLYNHRNSEGVLDEAMAVIKDDKGKSKNKARLDQFLSNQINVTEFVKWVVTDYPESVKLLKENPDYQLKFRNHKHA